MPAYCKPYHYTGNRRIVKENFRFSGISGGFGRGTVRIQPSADSARTLRTRVSTLRRSWPSRKQTAASPRPTVKAFHANAAGNAAVKPVSSKAKTAS